MEGSEASNIGSANGLRNAATRSCLILNLGSGPTGESTSADLFQAQAGVFRQQQEIILLQTLLELRKKCMSAPLQAGMFRHRREIIRLQELLELRNKCVSATSSFALEQGSGPSGELTSADLFQAQAAVFRLRQKIVRLQTLLELRKKCTSESLQAGVFRHRREIIRLQELLELRKKCTSALEEHLELGKKRT